MRKKRGFYTAVYHCLDPMLGLIFLEFLVFCLLLALGIWRKLGYRHFVNKACAEHSLLARCEL